MLLSLRTPDINFYNKKFDILLLGYDTSRNIKIDNKGYQPLIDSVRDELEINGFNCINIDTPFSTYNQKNVWKESGVINRAYLISWLMDIASLNKKKYRTRLYKRIIKSFSIKCVFMFNAPIPLCEAANDCSIPCIELLHGIGYPKIPWGLEKRPASSLPTHVLSTDETSTIAFSDLQSKGVKIIQIANPFIKRFILPNLIKKLPNEWLETFRHIGNRKLIIISLQWGYSGEYEQYTGILPNGIFYEEFNEIFTLTKDEIFWGIRLHPVQLDKALYWRHLNYVNSLASTYENVNWEWFTYKPLPTVFKNASGHITMLSMTAYEAAYMGIKTLALCPTLQTGGVNEKVFLDIINSGYLEKKIFNKKLILDWIQTAKPREPYVIFDENSSHEITEIVSEILNKTYSQGAT